MEVGICAPISLLKRETAAPGQRETLEGDFVIPPPNHPLKRPKEGAAAPSLETPPNGAAAGLKVRRFDKYPGNLRKRHNLRHKRNLLRAFQRPRMRPGGFYPVVANNRPHPQTCPHAQVWTKRLFLPPCTAHSFSPRRKRMGGASPTPQVCGSKKSHRRSL